jgi:hypothetical protein
VERIVVWVGFLLVLIVFSILRVSFPHTIYRSGWYGRVVCVVFLVTWLAAMTSVWGTNRASNLIEGNLSGSLRVTLQMEDSSSRLGGKPFILVTTHDGHYYLIEQQSPAPQNPCVYVVPFNEVTMAEMQRLR